MIVSFYLLRAVYSRAGEVTNWLNNKDGPLLSGRSSEERSQSTW